MYTKYFDKSNRRLVYLGHSATPEFWDNEWQLDTSIRENLLRIKSSYVVRTTKQYLTPKDGIILEGGCGPATHVAALTNNGYKCIGVDSAVQTVSMLNQSIPELDIRLGDLRKLELSNGSIAGYWSLGVIEHFWEGYHEIGREMARVIMPKGFLFLTFPAMSTLRKFKALCNGYPEWKDEYDHDSFYQFALDQRDVIALYESLGFNFIKSEFRNGIDGVESEIAFLGKPLGKLSGYAKDSKTAWYLRAIMSTISAPVAGHSSLLIFQR
jgi:SAM-dependent methyltransferase